MLSEKGTLYDIRFRNSGKLEEIEKAVGYHNRAPDLTPDVQPYLPDQHASLGLSHNNRYKRTGKVADLVKAIEYFTHSGSVIHRSISTHGRRGGLSQGNQMQYSCPRPHS
ncbi:hypothetical protein AG1IA_05401 [Rhizoctonia solani AG-1 IA]|uniref:Uncharacterized protein n=1 Tax=Thanatephorus cucumeris (strain AG1-IA) TaxID=983506 RepID=L8WRD8_THACA|nr:hypothetical protein AG1IA_05401 [Rhizoctonia solani AG-1 IA]